VSFQPPDTGLVAMLFLNAIGLYLMIKKTVVAYTLLGLALCVVGIVIGMVVK